MWDEIIRWDGRWWDRLCDRRWWDGRLISSISHFYRGGGTYDIRNNNNYRDDGGRRDGREGMWANNNNHSNQSNSHFNDQPPSQYGGSRDER